MSPVSRRRCTLVALCVLAALCGWWLLTSTPESPTPSKEMSNLGIPICPLSTLPPEVTDTVRAIRSNGPFPFPRNDGTVFGNRETHLPDQPRGYYHEYTVITPGASNRSTRRVITGGAPVTGQSQYFYTADHYETFCLVSGAGGEPRDGGTTAGAEPHPRG